MSDNINISYKYDENGVRTQKNVNGITTDFITSGIKVLAQKSGENTIVWQIDGNGNTVGFNYNGTPYFYIKNAQGDIIAITDISGNLVAKYTYDSWGKLVSIKDSNDVDKTTDENFIGCVNPIRYRGYYYDSETGLYYLNARYYDPEVGRFISADDYEILLEENYDLLRYNIFIYCSNNPIMGYDPSGNVVTYMNPKDIRFSQNNISKTFYDGRTVQNMIDQLTARTLIPENVLAIRVFPARFIVDNYRRLGLTEEKIASLRKEIADSPSEIYFTLDNRRLFSFQQANMTRIKTIDAYDYKILAEKYKLTTFDYPRLLNGKIIDIRDN